MNKIESLILSCIVNMPENNKYISDLKECYFVGEITKTAFLRCKELFDKTGHLDVVSCSMLMQGEEEIFLHSDFLNVSNIENIIHLLIENYNNYKLGSAIIEAGENLKTKQVKEVSEKIIQDINSLENSGIAIQPDLSEKYKSFVEVNLDRLNTNKTYGFPWGIAELDEHTNGIIKGFLYVIGALKKAGKSRFMVFLANNLSKAGIKTLIISLEMATDQIICLLASTEYKINSHTFFSHRAAKYTEKIADIPNRFRDRPLYVEHKVGIDCNCLMEIIKEYKRKLDIDIVFIDFFQKLVFKSNDRANEMSDAAYRLGDLCKTLNLPIVILSQLNNEAEKANTPNIQYLKGTGGIGESCDCLIFLNNKNRTEHKNVLAGEVQNQDFEIIIDVQRYGESGVYIPITAQLQYCHFTNKEIDNGFKG